MAFVWGDENESAKKTKKEQLVRKEKIHERMVFWKPNKVSRRWTTSTVLNADRSKKMRNRNGSLYLTA